MTIILASIATLEAGVIVWLWRSRNKAWRETVATHGRWTADRIVMEQRIKELSAALREEVNKSRRNTGKAEI